VSGELIDFTAEALHARWEKYYVQGLEDECLLLSALIEGYLDGQWQVMWRDGDPYFSVTETARSPMSADAEEVVD